MNFQHKEYIPIVLTFFIFWCLANSWQVKKFNEWLMEYWAYKRTKRNWIGTALYVTGFGLLLFGLLDIRGREEAIQGKSSKQRTILLVDTSTSMLAEDIRPNRLRKALFLARHFVKKAVGHEIAVVVFSDLQKKLVPFTSDLDLIDARLQSLESLKIKNAGTNLSLAIQESIQYFKEGDEKSPFGNILIFTDAEDNELAIDVKVPDSITVGVVGIGTRQGGTIPLRNEAFSMNSTKEHHGKAVVTKLDEENIRKLSDKIKNFHYWIATSYAVPTEEILTFFSRQFHLKLASKDFKIKPVLAHYLVIPSILIIIMGIILRNFRNFTFVGMLLLAFNLGAQDKELSPLGEELLQKLGENDLSHAGKLQLADELRKAEKGMHAIQLYKEELSKQEVTDANKDDFLNYGTTLLSKGKIHEGMQVYSKIKEHLKNSPDSEFDRAMNENIVAALQQQEEQKKQDKQKKENKDQQDQQNQNNSGEGEGEEQKDQGQQGQQKKPNKGDEDKKDKEKNKEDKKKEEEKNKGDKDKDKDKKDDKGEEEKKQQEPEMSEEDKSKLKKKLPAMLKQLMNDDRKLQQKLDSSTEERKTRDKKDW